MWQLLVRTFRGSPRWGPASASTKRLGIWMRAGAGAPGIPNAHRRQGGTPLDAERCSDDAGVLAADEEPPTPVLGEQDAVRTPEHRVQAS